MSGPDYCPGSEVIVPIKLIKKSTGEVISEEVVTVNPGETSSEVTHPTVKSVKFTLTVEKVNEVCE